MPDEWDENKVLLLSWVLKKSAKTHQWKKRWAVLRYCQFSYYKSSSEHKPSTVINKTNLLSFASNSEGPKYSFTIYTNNKTYHFRVDSQQLFDQWIFSLKSLIQPADADEESHDDEANEAARLMTPNLSELPKSRDSREYLVEEGPLLVLKKRYNQWKKYHVAVTNKNVYVCKSKDKTQHPEKVIPVSRLLDVVEVDATKGKKWCLMLIESKKTCYVSALSEQDIAKFFLAIKAVIMQHQSSKSHE